MEQVMQSVTTILLIIIIHNDLRVVEPGCNGIPEAVSVSDRFKINYNVDFETQNTGQYRP
jgi:hypothetical protein